MKYRISSLVLLLSIFLFSCNKKTDEWLMEHKEEIATAVDLNTFFVPDTTILNEKKVLLEGFQKDLKEVAYTDWENEEAKTILIDLLSRLKISLNTINEYSSKAGNYRIVQYVKNEYEGDTSDATVFYKKINETLIQSDSFYLAAQANLQSIDEAEGQATVQQHFEDFHWLGDTLATNVKKSAISQTLKSELLMNIQMAQLYIKDYIGFVNSFIYNNSHSEENLENITNKKIEQ